MESFLDKGVGLDTTAQVFSCEFWKFFKTTFLHNISGIPYKYRNINKYISGMNIF